MIKKNRAAAMLLAVLLMASALSGCRKSADVTAVDTTIVVQTQKAESGSMQRMGNYVATVADTDAVYVVPLVSASVTELLAKVGQSVLKGDVLCRLDDTAAQLKLAGANADYSLAQNGMETAKAGYNTAAANYENAVASAEAQIGGNKTLNDYQLDANIDSLRDQLDELNRTIEGYVSLVDSANSAAEYAQSALNSAQAAYAYAQADYEQALAGLAATGGNAAALSEKKAAAETAYSQVLAAQNAYTQALSQSKTVNDGAITLKENKDKLEKAIEQANEQKEIVNGDIYQDTLSIVESTKNVAASAVESARVGLETAQIHIEAAQVGIEAAEYELSLYTLTAPVDGVVEQVNISENNMAAAGNVSIVISNPQVKSAIFFVSDEVRSVLKLGQEVSASSGSGQYDGVITEIGLSVDSTTGLFMVKAALNGAGKLANGTKVELITKTRETSEAVMVPWQAVYFENGKTFLYVDEDGVAKKREVEIALYNTETIALSSGIRAGEDVIVTWSASLKDGAPVRGTQEAQ